MANLDWQTCAANSVPEEAIPHTIYKRWLIHQWGTCGFCIVPLESRGNWNVEKVLARFPFWPEHAGPATHDTCGKAPASETSQEDRCLWAEQSSIEKLLELLDRTERDAWEQAKVAVI